MSPRGLRRERSSSSFKPPRNFNQNRADRSAPLGRRAPQERLMAARTQTVDWQRKQYRGRHVVWCGRACLWVCVIVVTNPTVKRRNMATVFQSSVNDTSKEPLCSSWRVRQNCPCHGCSLAKESFLDFEFPSVLERFRRYQLADAAGCDVCCVLQCPSDGRAWSPVSSPDKGIDGESPGCASLGLQSDSFRSNAACAAAPRAAAALGVATHIQPHCVLGQQRQ